jgi:anti-sigma factor RsiW
MDQEQELSDLLRRHRSDLRYAMPPGLKESLIAEQARKPRMRETKPWFWIASTALASCLALVLTFKLGELSSRGPRNDVLAQEVISGHVRSLMESHLLDVASTDQHTVKPWFEGKLDFAPAVKDFATEGFPLLGGRLDYLESRPVAALVYKRNQHVINVYEWPSTSAGEATPRLLARRGYQLFAWQENGLNYWAVSDLNAAELQEFVKLWR